jgi:plasmid stabilization system protein ParE
MKRIVQLRRAAQAEYDETIDFYEVRGAGLGIALERADESVFDEIVVNPKRYPLIVRNIREAPVLNFPFVVYYRVESDRIIVPSVFHSSRDPEVWRSRR